MGSDKPFLIHLWRGLQEQFGRASIFCDVILCDHSESPKIRFIPVHSIILASISSFLSQLLAAHPKESAPIYLSLPKEISFNTIQSFLKIIYNKLCYSDLGNEVISVPISLIHSLHIDSVLVEKKIVRGRRKSAIHRAGLSPSVDVQGFIPILGRFLCPFECGELFKSQFALNTHLKTHGQPSSFMCEECGLKKESFEALKVHKNTLHREVQCKICSQTLTGRYALKKHKELIHNKRIQCPHCSKDFQSKQYLRKHLLTMHVRDEDKKLSCDHCHKRFAHSSVLKHHLDYCRPKIHSDICTICGKGFKFKYLLRRHTKRVHAGLRESELKCNLCLQVFNKSDFYRHRKECLINIKGISSAKSNTSQKDGYSCKFCGSNFILYSQLHVHIRTNHQGIQCPHCHLKFTHTSLFNRHMKSVHTHKRLLSCPKCPFVSLNRRSVIEHEAYKHNRGIGVPGKRYPCSLCRNTYQNETLRRSHFKKTHEDFQITSAAFPLLQNLDMGSNEEDNDIFIFSAAT